MSDELKELILSIHGSHYVGDAQQEKLELIYAHIDSLRSQLEAMQWIKTTDRLPELNEAEIAYGASHIDCWIFVNGMVGDLPFNVHHQCWDDDQYDDFKFAATKPTHWMRRVDPLPPVPDKPEV